MGNHADPDPVPAGDVVDDGATHKGGYGERSLPAEADGGAAGAARRHAESTEPTSPPAGGGSTPGEQGA